MDKYPHGSMINHLTTGGKDWNGLERARIVYRSFAVPGVGGVPLWSLTRALCEKS